MIGFNSISSVTCSSSYYYLPVNNEELNAPFLHARQEANDGKCGFYVLNTYLGVALSFNFVVDALADYMVQYRGVETKEDALFYLHPFNEDGSLNTLDLLDVDIEMIRGILPVVSSNHISEFSAKFANTELMSYDLFEKNWVEISHKLSHKLKEIDRFILGIASPVENHLICWRKDLNNCWWKIDSLLSEQTCFKNEEAALSEIYFTYGSYPQGILLFLVPSLSL